MRLCATPRALRSGYALHSAALCAPCLAYGLCAAQRAALGRSRLTLGPPSTSDVCCVVSRALHPASSHCCGTWWNDLTSAGYEQFILGDDIAMVAIFVSQARLCNIRDEVSHWTPTATTTAAATAVQASSAASTATAVSAAPPAKT